MARLYVPKPPPSDSETATSTPPPNTATKPPPKPSPPSRRPRRSSPTAQLEADLSALHLNAPPLSTDSAASDSDSESELRARPPALDTIYRTPPKRTTLSRLVRGTDRRVQCSPEMGVVYRDVRRYVMEGEDDVTESSESEGSLAGFVVGDDEVEYESDAGSGDESLLVGKKIWDVPLKRRTPARRRWEEMRRSPSPALSKSEEESGEEEESEEEEAYSEAATSPPRERRTSGKRQWSKVEVMDISDSESDAQSPFEKMPSESPFQSGGSEDESDSSVEDQSFVSAASVLTEKKVNTVIDSDSEAELRAKPPSPGPFRKRIIRASSVKSVRKEVVVEPQDDTMDTDSEAELRAEPPATVQIADESLEITEQISEVVLDDNSSSDSDVIFIGTKETKRKSFVVKKEPSPEPESVAIKLESPERDVLIQSESSNEFPEPDATAAILEYSPPRRTKPRPLSPVQVKREERTPSPPFTKSTKKIPRIPATPFQQSDVNGNFWDVQAVNDWNERHSPVKTVPTTPGLKVAACAPLVISDGEPEACDSGDDGSSGTAELRSVRATTVEPKTPAARKPRKRASEVKFAAEQRVFIKRRPEIAESLVKEIDEKVGNSYLSRFYAGTGGIKVVWKRNFRTTAGMAHYGINRKRLPSGEVTEEPYANILLSEKLLLTEQKLIDTVAHEVCHLLAGVIGQSKISHGKVFREWGRRIEKALPGRNIKIETFHDYQTEKRYEWTCTNDACGYIYKRESKSIDVTKYGCGLCKSKLVQTKPVPTQRKETEWQKFIKENMKRVKEQNPKVPQKEIMGLLSKEFKEMKAKREVAEKNGEKGLVGKMQTLEV